MGYSASDFLYTANADASATLYPAMTEPDFFCGKAAYEKLINKGFDVMLDSMLEPNSAITRKPHLVAALDKIKESGKFPELFPAPREPESPQ